MGIVPSATSFGNWEPFDSPLAWGSSEAPLLPLSLRALWDDEVLPSWVARDLLLAEPVFMRQLDATVALATGVSVRLKNYLALLVHSRRHQLEHLTVIDRPWPAQLSPDQVPWRLRTRNCLIKSRVIDKLSDLTRLTFGNLFDVPGMGAASVLDFACTLESALDALSAESTVAGQSDKAVTISSILDGVLDEPWADWVSERDLRFADLFPKGTGTITARIDELTSDPAVSPIELEALAESVERVRTRIRSLSKQSLEEQLRDYVIAAFRVRDRRLPAIIARLHLGGEAEASTLEEAGALAGVTRERIRQIEARGRTRHPSHPIVMPQLDRALDTLLGAAPIGVNEASQLLVDEGISRAPFHPASVIAAARLCGRSTPVEIRRIYDKVLVVGVSPDNDAARRVILLGRRQAAQAGASSVSQVSEALAREGIELAHPRIAALLHSPGGAEFLSEEWFCFPSSPNDVVRNLSRKMLSVTSPLNVSSLREGIKRYFRFRQSSARRSRHIPAVPPRDVLAQYYRSHSDFAIDAEGKVRSVVPLDYRSELVGAERAMVTVLKAAPSRTLDRPTLTDLCVERGVNVGTLWTLATYSPVMEHLDTGLWTLRGSVVDATVVEAFRNENSLRPRERRVVDYGWLPSGELWLAVRVPEHWQMFAFPVPADIQRLLVGRDFDGTDVSGTLHSVVRVPGDNRINGIHPLLRQTGAEEDDIVLLRFDLARATVVVSVIDDDALEELNPAS